MSALNRQRNMALGRTFCRVLDLSNEIFHSGMKIDASRRPGMRTAVDKESAATERLCTGHDVNGQSVIAPCCARSWVVPAIRPHLGRLNPISTRWYRTNIFRLMAVAD
nr:hypothetical protein [Burkholderia latens]